MTPAETTTRPAPITFRHAEVERALRARAGTPDGPVSAIASRDLARYYDTIARSLATLTFSEAEASAICDALNGTMLDSPDTYRFAWAEIADADRLNGLGEKWGVDGQALAARVRALHPAELVALVDAVDRFWTITTHDASARPAREVLIEVGLLRG
jgi:hypothetical protein